MTELSQRVKSAVAETIKDIVVDDSEVWEAIDEALTKDLEDSHCWLSFHSGQAKILVGLGSGDAAREFPVEITLDDYADISKTFPSYREDIVKQIQGIDAFTAELAETRTTLVEALKRYEPTSSK